MTENDVRNLPVEALAYLGDSVWEKLCREEMISRGFLRSAALNRESLRYVTAVAQSEAVEKILPMLTEEETCYFRRGRNIGHTNTPKSCTATQYRTATGLEVLCGALSLLGREDRLAELFRSAYPANQNSDKEV